MTMTRRGPARSLGRELSRRPCRCGKAAARRRSMARCTSTPGSGCVPAPDTSACRSLGRECPCDQHVATTVGTSGDAPLGLSPALRALLAGAGLKLQPKRHVALLATPLPAAFDTVGD